MAGWSVTQIVEQVNRRTENRASKLIDLRMEFFLALDEFCNEQHFWWRKKRSSFTTAINTQSYDLSVAAGGSSPDLVELDEMILLNADGVTVAAELIPLFDPQQILAATVQNVQDTPASYFIDPKTSIWTLFLQAPANVAQKILYGYWAIPMVTDPTQDTIPLLPPYLHWGMLPCLEKRVYEFLYGQEDPRFAVASANRENFVLKASRTPHWSGRKTQEARANELTVNTVQAHG